MNEQRGPRRPTVMRFAGAGIELAGACLAGGLIGYIVDRFLLQAAEQWGFLIGGLLGFALGMANLIRLAMKFNR
ncbi:MAG: AtpZ/AtpI family protein [Pirellulaceae bacterium]